MNRSPLLLSEVLRAHSVHRGRLPAITDQSRTLTYAELWDRSTSVRDQLRDDGYTPGDLVAVAASGSVDHVCVIVGILRAGMVVAPLNPHLTSREQQTYVGRIGAAVAFVDTTGGDPSWRHFDELLASGSDGDVNPDTANEDDLAIAFPTGGTTGTPKAARWSHRSLVLALLSSAQNLRVTPQHREVYLSPFFHVTMVTGLLTTLLVGGTASLHRQVDDDAVATLLSPRPSRVFATPTVMARVLAMAGPGPHPAARPTLIFGAARSSADFAKTLLTAFPAAQVFTGYGATEFGAVTRVFPEEINDGRGVGRPVSGVRLKIVDDSGAEQSAGTVGEIMVSSPWQMDGYLAGAAADEPFTVDGFIRSGDLGLLDRDGYLHLAGRRKELIKTGGEAVFPAEVEDALLTHPAVAEAAVVGRPDPEWGERVEAAVVLTEASTTTVSDLVEHCRANLARFKVPKRILAVEALPYTPNMKLDRAALMEVLASC
ncbi:class I adenylate-forming enzyme family protein [Desertimonas flava]|uniref:class I adenylate-forming enzyme family protein n=1 Tax=Desertimonas flava TaxID=2064846 RepID=UPI000E34B595|nr:class I adenylate-forming enzyme family protein [Desertimonas flava]